MRSMTLHRSNQNILARSGSKVTEDKARMSHTGLPKSSIAPSTPSVLSGKDTSPGTASLPDGVAIAPADKIDATRATDEVEDAGDAGDNDYVVAPLSDDPLTVFGKPYPVPILLPNSLFYILYCVLQFVLRLLIIVNAPYHAGFSKPTTKIFYGGTGPHEMYLFEIITLVSSLSIGHRLGFVDRRTRTFVSDPYLCARQYFENTFFFHLVGSFPNYLLLFLGVWDSHPVPFLSIIILTVSANLYSMKDTLLAITAYIDNGNLPKKFLQNFYTQRTATCHMMYLVYLFLLMFHIMSCLCAHFSHANVDYFRANDKPPDPEDTYTWNATSWDDGLELECEYDEVYHYWTNEFDEICYYDKRFSVTDFHYFEIMRRTLLLMFGNTIIGPQGKSSSTVDTYFEIMYLVGGFMVATVFIGQFTSLFTSTSSITMMKMDEINAVNKFLQHHGISKELQINIQRYFEYLWSSGRSSHIEASIEKIRESPLLNLELNLELKGSLLIQSQIFRSLLPSSLTALMENMISVIAMPGEPIIVQGSIGTSMYFVARGHCTCFRDVRDGEGEKTREILTQCYEGDAFGEIALIMHTKRTGTVEAVGFCELEQLEKDAVLDLMEDHDDLCIVLENLAQERVDKDDERGNLELIDEDEEYGSDEDSDDQGIKTLRSIRSGQLRISKSKSGPRNSGSDDSAKGSNRPRTPSIEAPTAAAKQMEIKVGLIDRAALGGGKGEGTWRRT